MAELTNAEKMNHFCSLMNGKLGTPYVFSWEPVVVVPNTEKDELVVVEISIQSSIPVNNSHPVIAKRVICKTDPHRITELYFPLNYGLVPEDKRYTKADYPIKAESDIDSHIEGIKTFLHDYLFTTKY
jgi:hypothetical protein